MSSARAAIFADIRKALEVLPSRAPRPEVPRDAADVRWLAGETDNVVLFQKRAAAAGTLCFMSPQECASWLAGQQPRKIYIPESLMAATGQLNGFAGVTRDYSRGDVDEIDVAFTPAVGAIAESGTIILTDQSTPDRLAALAPWTHVAVVNRESIHRSIADALASMPDDPNVIWVTGPSKTADVEGILIEGVHGPGVQGCLLI